MLSTDLGNVTDTQEFFLQVKVGRYKRLEGYCILYADYFTDDPLHGKVVFRHCFRMSRKLFLDIVYAVQRFDNYFICNKDCTSMVGFSSFQKCTAALRMLSYGHPGDSQDNLHTHG
jgi:hypothetical protein